jgi:PhoPQ-activated pathogenicity-related protein
MVDPWVYRDKLKLPKLLINGNNDPYWAADALNLYWDDLPGEKWITYVPNAGHNLQQKGPEGKPDLSRAVNALAVFARSQIHDTPLPTLAWNHGDRDSKLTLTIDFTQPAKAARMWIVRAPTRDFRQSAWSPKEMTLSGQTAMGEIDRPESGGQAVFGELEFDDAGLTYQLSTQVRIVNAK